MTAERFGRVLRRCGRSVGAACVLALLAASAAPAVSAQEAHHPPRAQTESPRSGAAGETARAGRPAEEARKLPADSTTDQAIDLPGRTLRFRATAGSIPLYDGDSGALRAEIAYVSYVKDGAGRPVTFLFNGGPGAASAYLNVGAVGPWRLPLDPVAPSTPPSLLPNAETWLDFTDLVFIDPVGTGYSRAAGSGDARRQFWSVDGDADALAVVIRKWLENNGRQAAQKFIVGESYGGFRALKVARALQRHQGVGVRGMVLLSPVLDFASLGQRRHVPISWVSHLPSMAAAALELKGSFDRQALREAEAYASGDYLRDLMRGEQDRAAIERMTPRVAALTGLDPALVRRLGARVDTGTFQREIYRGRGLVASAYDPSVTAYDPSPYAAISRFPDPMLDGTKAPLTSAMTELYQRVLRWRVEQPYRLLDSEVGSHWNWGGGRSAPEAVDDLRNLLAGDPTLRIMVAHGASDLVTPYFANQLIVDQMPAFGSADRLRLAVYPGGHMFYSRNDARLAWRNDALDLYAAAGRETNGRE